MRLIDADALKDCMFNGGQNFDRVNGNEHFIFGVETAIEAIDYAPTIDPVKHSRWFEGHCVRCFYDFGYGKNTSDFNYCPNCGARMDGDAE